MMHGQTKIKFTHVLLRHTQLHVSRVISGFRREISENCALLGHYAASSGNLLLMFRYNLSVLSLGFKNQKKKKKKNSENGTDMLSRKVVNIYHYSLRNDTEQRSSQLHVSTN